MKKIAYIIKYENDYSQLSVNKKILQQKKTWEKLGINVCVFAFSEKIENVNKEFKNIQLSNEKTKNKIIQRKKLINILLEEIRMFDADIIYLRDCMFNFNLHKSLSKIAPLFVEIQTDIFNEFKINNKKRFFIERFIRRRYLKHVKGLICITDEIGKKELRLNNKPVFILGNGVEADKFIEKEKKYRSEYINLVFIGTPNTPWNGIERILRSFTQSKNRDKFNLHIIGYENDFNINEENIKFYGYVNDEKEINKIIDKCDIGIGTMALFKKGMNEAAPLKVRKYLQRRIPIIIGYNDTDISEELPFVFRVENNDTLINFNDIESFFIDNYSNNYSDEIQKFIEEVLLWDVKYDNLLKFLEGNI